MLVDIGVNEEGSREKARRGADKLHEMKLSVATRKVEESVEETLTYMNFPTEH